MKRLVLPLWIILACLRLSYSDNLEQLSVCPNGWFGVECQYKCRCTENKCEPSEGTCSDGASCELGWFGPACQYFDLAQHTKGSDSRRPVNTIIDGKEKTCLNAREVIVSLVEPCQLSWFRAYVKDSYFLDKLNIQFKEQPNSSLLACDNKRTALVSDTALDIHCDLNVKVTQVILTGESVQFLCSFYISGGRNVALNQKTAQSTQFDHQSQASNAVDGDTRSWVDSGSCSHTDAGKKKANWNVTFCQPALVNRYVIYNRDEDDQWDQRLKGFQLTSYYPAGVEVFQFIDTAPTEQIVYTVTSLAKEVQTVNIEGKWADADGDIFVTLCEVEVYGDSVCEPGLYGRNCEHKCNCADRYDTCFVSTGGCPSGCASGFQGESCKEACDHGTYGENCSSSCSQFCVKGDISESVCDHIDGRCLHGCQAGYHRPKCDEPCSSGTYGQDCSSVCNQFCEVGNMSEPVCDHIHGACLLGCQAGFSAPMCNESCDHGNYGEGCSYSCSQFCVKGDISESVCDHIGGRCLHGCQAGYQAPKCDEQCESGHYGPNCSDTCPQLCLVNVTNEQRVCHHVVGTCLQGCQPGYARPMCEETCSNGIYGQDCSSVCPQSCEVGNMSQPVCDHIHGACLLGCQAGYLGSMCDKLCDSGSYGPGCSLFCPELCKVKNMDATICHHSNGTCLQGCQDGYIGPMCNQSCDHGTYGEGCSSSCSQFCVKGDISESVCDHIDGRCLHGCQAGYQAPKCDEPCDHESYGENCSSSCSQFCVNWDISESVCDHIDGRCLHGCQAGYQGPKCDEPCGSGSHGQDCSSVCPQFCEVGNMSQPVCDHIHGACLLGCQAGYLGSMCDKSCDHESYGEGCSSSCSQFCVKGDISESVCDHIEGRCLHGCQAGYQGPKCNEPCSRGTHGQDCSSVCPQFCEVGNMSEPVCDPIDGVCLLGCQAGYSGSMCDESCDHRTYGENCSSSCSQFCVKGDISESVCDHIDGRCLHGCQAGYQGLKCDEQCDTGTYGQDCNYTCPQYCENTDTSQSVCHYISGACTQGCLPGYNGVLCHEQCDSGTYGQDCNSTCSKYCEKFDGNQSVCHHFSGVCTHGCLPGYKGGLCDEANVTTSIVKGGASRKEDSLPVHSTTLWAVCGSIIVAVLVVVGVIVWRFKKDSCTMWTFGRKKLQKSDSTTLIMTTEMCEVDKSVSQE